MISCFLFSCSSILSNNCSYYWIIYWHNPTFRLFPTQPQRINPVNRISSTIEVPVQPIHNRIRCQPPHGPGVVIPEGEGVDTKFRFVTLAGEPVRVDAHSGQAAIELPVVGRSVGVVLVSFHHLPVMAGEEDYGTQDILVVEGNVF